MGDEYVDYNIKTDAFVRFRDNIYVSDNNDIKNIVLSEFHVKSYLGHTRY